MLLQTNSYLVPKEKRHEHSRLMRRFRQTLLRLGADHFEVYEQLGANWTPLKKDGRFIQVLRFRDRQHHQAIQEAERQDQGAQELIQEFCTLINFQQQQTEGTFVVSYYGGVMSSTGEINPQPGVEAAPDVIDKLGVHEADIAPRRAAATRPGENP
jgi:hypothetical protein